MKAPAAAGSDKRKALPKMVANMEICYCNFKKRMILYSCMYLFTVKGPGRPAFMGGSVSKMARAGLETEGGQCCPDVDDKRRNLL